MNQVFDFKRWGLLLGRHWSENRKKYTLSLMALASLFLVWFVFTLIMDWNEPIEEWLQAGTYFFGLFLGGCLFASMLLSDLASKSKGINFLSVPASQLEKLLCLLFFGVIVFFVCYSLIFYLLDIPFVKMANQIAYSHYWKGHMDHEVLRQTQVWNPFGAADANHKSNNDFRGLLLYYFSIQSVFILGSIYFPKFSFIKTVITLLLVMIFFTVFMGKLVPSILPKGSFYRGITSYQFTDGLVEQVIQLPTWIEGVLLFLVKYTLAPIFWVITYFRLKEKEI